MAKSSVKYFYQTLTRIRVALSTSPGDVVIAGSDDSDLLSLNVFNTGSSSRTLSIYKADGTNDDLVSVLTIPPNAGRSNGIPPIRLIEGNYIPDVISENTKIYCPMKAGDKYRMSQDVGTDLLIIGFQKDF